MSQGSAFDLNGDLFLLMGCQRDHWKYLQFRDDRMDLREGHAGQPDFWVSHPQMGFHHGEREVYRIIPASFTL